MRKLKKKKKKFREIKISGIIPLEFYGRIIKQQKIKYKEELKNEFKKSS